MEANNKFERLLDDTIEKCGMLEMLEQPDNPLAIAYGDDEIFDEYMNLIRRLEKQPNILTLPDNRFDDYINISNLIRKKLARNKLKLDDIVDEYYEAISKSYDAVKNFIIQQNNKQKESAACFENLTVKCSAALESTSFVCALLRKNIIDLKYLFGISFDHETTCLSLNVYTLEFDCELELNGENIKLDLHVYTSAFTFWVSELRKHFWVEGKISIENTNSEGVQNSVSAKC